MLIERPALIYFVSILLNFEYLQNSESFRRDLEYRSRFAYIYILLLAVFNCNAFKILTLRDSTFNLFAP